MFSPPRNALFSIILLSAIILLSGNSFKKPSLGITTLAKTTVPASFARDCGEALRGESHRLNRALTGLEQKGARPIFEAGIAVFTAINAILCRLNAQLFDGRE